MSGDDGGGDNYDTCDKRYMKQVSLLRFVCYLHPGPVSFVGCGSTADDVIVARLFMCQSQLEQHFDPCCLLSVSTNCKVPGDVQVKYNSVKIRW